MNTRRSVSLFTIYVTPVVSIILAGYFFIEMMDSYQMMSATTAHLNDIDINTTDTSAGELLSVAAVSVISAAAGFGFILFRALLIAQIALLLWWTRLLYVKKFYVLGEAQNVKISLTFEAKVYALFSCALYTFILVLLFG